MLTKKQLQERIEKLEATVKQLAQDQERIIGILDAMTKTLRPMYEEWANNKTHNIKESEERMYR